MATTFTGLRVQDTYNAILKIGDNSNLTGTAKLLSDGFGNSSAIYLSTTSIGIGVTPSYQLHTSSNAKIGGNLIVSGNLTVNGTLTYLNVEDLAVEDPLIKLAKDNTANTLDIGFFGKYVATGTKYKGLFNDASDDKFKLFIGTGTEPTTIAPDITWPSAALVSARTAINSAKAQIQSDAVQFVKRRFPTLNFDEALCSRDVGYIVDALGYDLMFGSNFLSIQSGLSYRRGITSTEVVITTQLTAQQAVIDFIGCLLYTSPSPRDRQKSRMPSSA